MASIFDGIVGGENVREVAAGWAVAPADAQQCAAVLRLCGERRLVVVPTGGGTKMGWGNPVSANLILETRRMSGVRDHSWQDLTATIGAGTIWTAMQHVLAEHRQRVALDPLWPERATVGGIVSANDSGALRLRFGSLRDLIIGMTVVLADGTIARSGGKVVKNVAGYDLHKLMTGAYGTLGVVTEVIFRLHPLERGTETWTLQSADAEALGAVMMRVLDSTLVPASLQMQWGSAGFRLDVRFASLPEGLAASAARLREIAGGLECFRAEDHVWEARARTFIDKAAFVVKITMLPATIAAVMARLAISSAQANIKMECAIDAVGIGTVALRGEAASTIGLIADLRRTLVESGGALVVLQVPSEAPEGIDRWGPEPAAIGVMRDVKQQFDPQRTLNPGRYVGGI